MKPDAFISFWPEKAFAPAHCDAWTEVMMLMVVVMRMRMMMILVMIMILVLLIMRRIILRTFVIITMIDFCPDLIRIIVITMTMTMTITNNQ